MTAHDVPQRHRRAARSAGQYVLLALGLSWLVWVPSLLLLPDSAFPLVVLGAFGPAVAAAVMVRREGRSVRGWLRDIVVFRFPARWYAFALAVPLLIAVAQTAFAAGTGVPLAPAELPARIPAFLISALLVFFIGGGQEEPGWRGYLLPVLQSRVTPLTASVVVGVVWAAWHLPLFALGFEGYAEVSFAVYLPTLIALSVVHTYLWNRTGSVIASMVLHAGTNAARNLVVVPEAEAEAFGQGLGSELAWAAAPVVVALALLARAGRELGRSPDASAAGSSPRRRTRS